MTLTSKELARKVRKQPEDVLLLASLADAYLEEGVYAKALEVSSRAHALAPRNPLVLWDHARALYMNTRFADAATLHKKILKKRVATIARSMRWPEEKACHFQNTTRFDLALCYIQLDKFALAAEMLRDYITLCRSRPCYHSPALARAKLRSLERLSREAERRSSRLWISLVEVKARTGGRRTKYRRGFTNGLAMARTCSEAVTGLRTGMAELGYELITAEDTEEFERRLLKTEVPNSTKALAEEVRRDKKPRFTDFCMYPSPRQGKPDCP
jgi:hypothetical protein